MTLTIGFWIYIALTSIALFPPIFRIKPFTYIFARRTQPKIVQTTKKFSKTCLIINYMWFVIFAICAILSILNYSETKWLNITLQNALPAALQLIVALPLTIIGIKWLPQFIYEPNNFDSVHQLFALMPHGLNLRYAKKTNAQGTIQFKLTGREPLEGYLTFDTKKARFDYGICTTPTCTVEADSDLWLNIANGKADSIHHSIARDYTTNGNTAIMLHLLPLFTTQWRNVYPLTTQYNNNLYSEYRRIKPLDTSIKKCVIFYSGDRDDSISKTYFMLDKVAEGLQQQQVEVEIVKLKEKKINNCLGCFQCWTKTPGCCVHSDDMSTLLKHFSSADLIIFASPLYVFSVNGRMKSFLDRMIPYIQPYMAFDKQGNTYHPKRYNRIPPIVVIAAGGFPEVEGNFDGLRTLFRDYANHMEGCSLRGELLLPAAEYLSIHTFQFRKEEIGHLCIEAGKALAQQGSIPIEIMQKVSNIGMEKSYFGKLANLFWEHLDNKESYLKYIREEQKITK